MKHKLGTALWAAVLVVLAGPVVAQDSESVTQILFA